jgi:hypothetical protein
MAGNLVGNAGDFDGTAGDLGGTAESQIATVLDRTKVGVGPWLMRKQAIKTPGSAVDEIVLGQVFGHALSTEIYDKVGDLSLIVSYTEPPKTTPLSPGLT